MLPKSQKTPIGDLQLTATMQMQKGPHSSIVLSFRLCKYFAKPFSCRARAIDKLFLKPYIRWGSYKSIHQPMLNKIRYFENKTKQRTTLSTQPLTEQWVIFSVVNSIGSRSALPLLPTNLLPTKTNNRWLIYQRYKVTKSVRQMFKPIIKGGNKKYANQKLT